MYIYIYTYIYTYIYVYTCLYVHVYMRVQNQLNLVHSLLFSVISTDHSCGSSRQRWIVPSTAIGLVAHCDTPQMLLVSVTMEHFLAALHRKIVHTAEHMSHASLNSDSFNLIRVSAVTGCSRV